MAEPRKPVWLRVPVWTVFLTMLACGSHGRVAALPAPPTTTSGASGSATRCATPSPDQVGALGNQAISVKDSGKTMVLHETERFSVYLDDGIYPLDELRVAPEGLLSYISNGSIRGPDCYPRMFEAVGQGKVVLRDRDFQLQIVIDDSAPESTIPVP